MKNTLIDVVNYQRSVVELYLSQDRTEIIEVKCLPENKVKESTYPVETYVHTGSASNRVKNKIKQALAL